MSGPSNQKIGAIKLQVSITKSMQAHDERHHHIRKSRNACVELKLE